VSRLPPSVRQAVEEQAAGLCEYCRSSVELTGQAFTIDHILPTSRRGVDDPENLCFCCFECNNYKHVSTTAIDARTGRSVPLYNPRTDDWEAHFRWSPTSVRIIGRTAVGRAMVQALRLNRPNLVRARRIWARTGLHPPM
jgi:hypothetical protein